MFCVCRLSINGRLLVLPYDRIFDKEIIDDYNAEGKLLKAGSKWYYGKILRLFINIDKAEDYVNKTNLEVEEDLLSFENGDKESMNYSTPAQITQQDFKELMHDIKAIKNSLEIIEADQVEIKKSIIELSELKTAGYEESLVNGDSRRKDNSYLPHEIVESALMGVQELDDDDEENGQNNSEEVQMNSQNLLQEITEMMTNNIESNGLHTVSGR